MKILVSCPRGRTFDSFFNDENIRYIQGLGEVVWNPFGRNMTAEETAEMLCGCDAYVSLWGAPRFDEKILDAASLLKVIVHLGNSLLPYVCPKVWRSGIRVVSAADYYAASRAEGTLAYIFAALRDIPEYSQRLKYKREWKHSWDNNRGLVGKTVGIVNYGLVAEHLAKLLLAFDVNVAVFDEKALPASHIRKYRLTQMGIKEVFSHSDIISIHSPSRTDRYHMISSDELSLLKRGALIVDTSDGGVLDRTHLASTLLTGRISAILDLCENEVFDIDESLFYLPNVTIMPHMSGPTPDIRGVIAHELLRECSEYIEHGIIPKHAVSFREVMRREGLI